MPKKPKFKPLITRVKLNPEQAILQCSCYLSGSRIDSPDDVAGTTLITFCLIPAKTTLDWYRCVAQEPKGPSYIGGGTEYPDGASS